MEPKEYLDHLHADAGRLVAAARAAGFGARVPTCPDWDVAALIEHVGAVYHHKVACMRLGRAGSETWGHHPPPGDDLPGWYEAALAELVGELEQRGPDAPSYTWQPSDQTVGFWYRRMAQETLVHRVDGELAAGLTPEVDEEMALDGVDEVLDAFLVGPWWGKDEWTAQATGAVALRAGDRAWRVTLEPEAVRTERGEGPADAEVSGGPYDMLMWVWGRPPRGEVTESGDPDALGELRRRLAYTTT